MGFDANIVYEQLEMQEHYYYDLGYFEGVRNTLMTLQRGMSMGYPKDRMTEKIEFVIEELNKELKKAKELHHDSEKKYIEFEGY